MSLTNKYRELITAARAARISDLQVKEQDGVLHIEGVAPSEETKLKLKHLYEQLDSDSSGDVVMNITIPQRNGQDN